MIFLIGALAVLLGGSVGAGMFFLIRFLRQRKRKDLILSIMFWVVVVGLNLGTNAIAPLLT